MQSVYAAFVKIGHPEVCTRWHHLSS